MCSRGSELSHSRKCAGKIPAGRPILSHPSSRARLVLQRVLPSAQGVHRVLQVIPLNLDLGSHLVRQFPLARIHHRLRLPEFFFYRGSARFLDCFAALTSPFVWQHNSPYLSWLWEKGQPFPRKPARPSSYSCLALICVFDNRFVCGLRHNSL